MVNPDGGFIESRLHKSALWYARRGWAVFPCVPRDKRPMTPNGCLDAVINTDQVNEWWDEHPFANIGIAAGASGLVVLDMDVDRGGAESMAMLQQVAPGLTDTVTAITGAGEHYYFAAPEGVSLSPGANVLGDGIDIRAGNSYVVAPPSIHPSGRTYAWEVACGPHERGLALLPPAVIDRLTKPQASREAYSAPESILSGGRNDALTRLAGVMRRRGLDAEEIVEALRAVNARRCSPPLADREVERIARSVARYTPAFTVAAPQAVPAKREAATGRGPVEITAVGVRLAESLKREPDPRQYATSIPHLDRVLRNLRPGEMTVLGAWTGVGKSGFAEQVALETSLRHNVLFMPLEIGVERAERRMLAKILRISESRIDATPPSEVTAAIADLSARKIEMAGPALGESIRYADLRMLLTERKPDLVVIDHLQHIEDWTPVYTDSAAYNAASIVRDLRQLAAEIGTHLFLVHQLKAQKIARSERPQIYDFADTSALARVADTVLCLHRPFRGDKLRDVIMEILVLKNRRGPEPWIHTHFIGESIAMFPMSQEEEENALCCQRA